MASEIDRDEARRRLDGEGHGAEVARVRTDHVLPVQVVERWVQGDVSELDLAPLEAKGTGLPNGVAARFENAVALELLRAVTSWTELGFGRFGLHFIRTKDQLEVDFVLVEDGRPVLLVDAALEARQRSPALIKFQDALKVPAVQLVGAAEGYRRIPNDGQTIVIAPACQYLAGLP